MSLGLLEGSEVAFDLYKSKGRKAWTITYLRDGFQKPISYFF